MNFTHNGWWRQTASRQCDYPFLSSAETGRRIYFGWQNLLADLRDHIFCYPSILIIPCLIYDFSKLAAI